MSSLYFVFSISQGGTLMFAGQHRTLEQAQMHKAQLGANCIVVQGFES